MYNRLWAQNLMGYCTVQSCHNSLVPLDTLSDIRSLLLHHCVVTGLYSTIPLDFCAQSLLYQEGTCTTAIMYSD